jgi:protein TonB
MGGSIRLQRERVLPRKLPPGKIPWSSCNFTAAGLANMHAQQHHSGGLLSWRLLGWIMLSALAHLLLLSMGGGATPNIIAPQTRLFIADIRYVTPESTRPEPTVQAVPENKKQTPVTDSPQPAPAQEATTARTPPPAVVELPFPFDAYYSASEVDVRAQPANDVALVYPWVEYKLRVSGVVQLTLLINERGGLDKVTVIDAKPPGVFEDAALEAVNKLQFTPALKNGQPVKSRKTIDVVFDPSDQAKPPASKQTGF